LSKEKLPELFCAVLCTTVVHNDMHARAVLKDECWFRFGFCVFRFNILCISLL